MSLKVILKKWPFKLAGFIFCLFFFMTACAKNESRPEPLAILKQSLPDEDFQPIQNENKTSLMDKINTLYKAKFWSKSEDGNYLLPKHYRLTNEEDTFYTTPSGSVAVFSKKGYLKYWKSGATSPDSTTSFKDCLELLQRQHIIAQNFTLKDSIAKDQRITYILLPDLNDGIENLYDRMVFTYSDSGKWLEYIHVDECVLKKDQIKPRISAAEAQEKALDYLKESNPASAQAKTNQPTLIITNDDLIRKQDLLPHTEVVFMERPSSIFNDDKIDYMLVYRIKIQNAEEKIVYVDALSGKINAIVH